MTDRLAGEDDQSRKTINHLERSLQNVGILCVLGSNTVLVVWMAGEMGVVSPINHIATLLAIAGFVSFVIGGEVRRIVRYLNPTMKLRGDDSEQ